MMKKIIKKLAALLVLLSTALNLASCLFAMPISAENLMDGITPNSPTTPCNLEDYNTPVTDFALRLFAASESSGENTLISPISVLAALAMTANGASGTTLSEMEQTLGLTSDDLNLYLYTYMNSLPQGEKCKLSVANSIWFKDDPLFTVNNAFLQKNADYYGAEIYKTPFNAQMMRDVNNWVNKGTDGMIPKILNSVPEEAIMYLINTIAFDAEWASIYEHYQVRDGIFTTESGEEQNVEFMYSTEGRYLSDGNATGFIKPYKRGNYAFVALLPNEGISVTDYIATIDAENLRSMISSAKQTYTQVRASIPKFKTEYEVGMTDILSEMGMPTAFDVTSADFSNLGSYDDQNIYIGRVLHKTYIEVAEKGTKAGAVTVVQMNGASAEPPEEPKEVYLDRPFVYMIIDYTNNVPLFIGTMMDINK